MTKRQQVHAVIKKVPDEKLGEVLDYIRGVSKRRVAKVRKPNLMEELRKIKIDAPPDFSENWEKYANGGENGSSSR
ncbi:MAG TPA: hypothetical protein VKX17_10915 [Planctomycetota bacterium]|nr:hypothetical protein [Planctomycetota bacterium]